MSMKSGGRVPEEELHGMVATALYGRRHSGKIVTVAGLAADVMAELDPDSVADRVLALAANLYLRQIARGMFDRPTPEEEDSDEDYVELVPLDLETMREDFLRDQEAERAHANALKAARARRSSGAA